jgi:uncharacterized ferritin-like protein (DUF455 family)
LTTPTAAIAPPASLSAAAAAILAAADPAEKCRLTRLHAAAWRARRIAEPGREPMPARPARPDRPPLLPPREMKRRSYGGGAGRVALLHALAHIELNAVDLAWDIVGRYTDEALPDSFYDDWVTVAEEEALHFEMLAALLAETGAAYGDLPAHDGLWQAAEKTADDLLARLALVPLTLEARGCDTTPATIAKLERNGDAPTADALAIISRDEIGHVAAGMRWFLHVAALRNIDPRAEYRRLLAERFRGALKPPFNHAARAQAGMPRDWYEEDGVQISPARGEDGSA